MKFILTTLFYFQTIISFNQINTNVGTNVTIPQVKVMCSNANISQIQATSYVDQYFKSVGLPFVNVPILTSIPTSLPLNVPDKPVTQCILYQTWTGNQHFTVTSSDNGLYQLSEFDLTMNNILLVQTQVWNGTTNTFGFPIQVKWILNGTTLQITSPSMNPGDSLLVQWSIPTTN